MAPLNYKKYSLSELYDVKRHIDKQAYPENYRLLLAEIKLKESEPEKYKDELKQKIEARVKEVEREAPVHKSEEHQQKKLSRIYGYILLFIFIGVFSLPAYFYSFLLEPKYHKLFNISAWIVAAITLVLGTRHYLKCDVRVIELRQRKIFKLTTEKEEKTFLKYRAVIVSIILAFFAYFVAAKTIPVLAHEYFLEKQKTSRLMTIADKNSRYRRKHCNGKVYIQEYEYSIDDFAHICGKLSKNTWGNLEKGDKLRVFGTQSKIGFLVKVATKT